MSPVTTGNASLTDIADPWEGDKDFPDLKGGSFADLKYVICIVNKTVSVSGARLYMLVKLW
jgi:hypothetical protein